jgi:hypothetical protein
MTPEQTPTVYIVFTWTIIVLFVFTIVLTAALLVQRKTKRRTEFSGPAPTAEEIAYLNGGRDRAIRAALAAQDLTTGGLRQAVARAYSNNLIGPALLTPAVLDAVDQLARSLHARGLTDGSGRPTEAATAATRDARDLHGHLWPGYSPDWASCTGEVRAMAVAVFGDAVLESIDPSLAAVYPLTAELA